MKFSLEWHAEGLANMRIHLAEKQQRVMRAVAERDRLQAEIDLKETQIAAAVAKGLDGFDAAKFGQKRKAT